MTMKKQKLKLSALLLLGVGLTGVQAQESNVASGGDASGSGGSASYSVGQLVYTTNTGANGSVAQGVQQPYEISTITGLEEASEINLELSAYPNPVTNFLNLRIGNYDNENLSYQLYDMSGKLIRTSVLTNSNNIIQMENLVMATYFLKVMDSKNEIKTFKIVKH